MEEILVATHSHWLDNAKTLCMAYMLFNLVLKYLLLIFHVSNIFKVQNHKVDKLIIEDSDLNFWNLAHLIIIPTLKLHDINNSLCTYVPFMDSKLNKRKNGYSFIASLNMTLLCISCRICPTIFVNKHLSRLTYGKENGNPIVTRNRRIEQRNWKKNGKK